VFIPLLLGILQARRTWYSNDDVLGKCDRDGDCRGLLLTLGECDHPAWERLLKESLQSERLPIPQLSFRDTASCLPFLCFFTFACLVPQNFHRILTPQLSLFQFQELESLQDTVEYIEDEELIPEEEIEAIKAELERMKQHRERNSDSSWESLDTLKERIATNLEETRQALAGAEEAIRWGDEEQVEMARDRLRKRGISLPLPDEGGAASSSLGRRELDRLTREKMGELAESMRSLGLRPDSPLQPLERLARNDRGQQTPNPDTGQAPQQNSSNQTPGETPGQTGQTSDQPGQTSDQPGQTSDQPGQNSGQPGQPRSSDHKAILETRRRERPGPLLWASPRVWDGGDMAPGEWPRCPSRWMANTPAN